MPHAVYPYRIGIIGGGASGVLVAAQIARQAKIPCRVLLHDPADRIGGLAYGTSELCHLLNVPAAKISALPDEPAHFLEWLNDPGNCAGLLCGDQQFGPNDFAPRALYARYLASVLRDAFRAPGCVARLDVRPLRAVDFIASESGGTLVTSDADTEDVSHLVLALGNLPPRDPLNATLPFFSSKRYVANVWANGALRQIDGNDDVLIIGTGLTGIDVVLALDARGHRGKYVMTSRGGRLPQPHAAGTGYGDFLSERKFPVSARGWLRLIRDEIARAAGDGIGWRGVVDAIRPHTQRIWMALPIEEKKRFLRHARPFWESHRHRVPPTAWARVEALRAEDRLELVPGRIRDFFEDETGVSVRLQPKGRPDLETLRVQWVANCIGPESNFRQHFNDPLIINLMARGLIHPDPLLLGLDATPEGEVIGADGAIAPHISLIGPPLRGLLWETTAIPEIRVQAQRLAARIVATMSEPSWEI